MRLIGQLVGRLRHMSGGRKTLRQVALVDHRGIGRLRRPHGRVQLGIARQRGIRLPGDLEVAGSLDGIPLALGHHADQIALAQDTRAGNVLDRALVDAQRLGAGAVGALPARPHHPAVQHVGHAHMLHVGVFGADLVGQIEPRHPRAHQLVLADRLARRGAGEREMHRLVAEKIAVAHRPAGIAGDRDDAFRYRQVGNRRAQPR